MESRGYEASPDQKLKVLARIARALNEAGIVWAVGASLLLYLKGKTDSFHDIDVMVSEADVEKLKGLLLPMGILAPPNTDRQYQTKHFLEFTIDGVEVDVMAGFVIVSEGRAYACPFSAEQVAEYAQVGGERIPLQSLDDWRRYYALMGRTSKVEMIDR